MKKVIFLLAFLFAVAMVSCQDQQNVDSDTTNQFLENIAKHPSYKAYTTVKREVQLNVTLGNFDMRSLLQLAEENPQYQTACDVPKDKLTGIKGGLLHQELECKLHTLGENLKKEIPGYFTLSKEQRQKVSENYDRIEGIDWTKTIENALNARFKN